MNDELFVFLFTVMHSRSPGSLARSLLGFTACWHPSVTLTILATQLTTRRSLRLCIPHFRLRRCIVQSRLLCMPASATNLGSGETSFKLAATTPDRPGLDSTASAESRKRTVKTLGCMDRASKIYRSISFDLALIRSTNQFQVQAG